MVQNVKKVVALTIAGAAAVLVAGWRRVQRDNTLDGDGPGEDRAAEAEGGTGSPEVGPESTKAELYEIAQELEIEGRSSMTKAELLKAIRASG